MSFEIDRITGRRSRVLTACLTACLSGIVLMNPPPAASDLLYATETTTVVTGLLLTPRDIARDAGTGPLTTQAIGDLPESAGINAFDELGAARLFTSRITVELPGPLFATRQDVVRSEGGSYSLELDGSAQGVPLDAAIDAVSRTSSGDLLISFDTSVELGGLFVGDEDLVRFDGATFSLFFDGSEQSIAEALDLDGATYDEAADALLLSFDGAGVVGGIGFAREDVLRFARATATWSLELDASDRDPGLATTNLVAVPEPLVTGGLAAGLLLMLLMLLPVARPNALETAGGGPDREPDARRTTRSIERIDITTNTTTENSIMKPTNLTPLLLGLALALAFLPLSTTLASAQGYIEINQAVVDSSGGFPYAISQPGYYRLTGNVTKSADDGNVAAILISTSNVTLDLGGFTLSGPGICARNASTGVVTCTGHVPGSGIQESGGNSNVQIRNGSVAGFFNGISTTAASASAQLLTVYDNAFVGVSLIGDASTVTNVTAVRNGTNGIVVQNNSSVQNCDASQNDDYGILANLASAATENSVMGNRLGGMSLNPQSVFAENNVLDNFGTDPVFSGIDGGGNTCTNAAGTPVGC